MKKTICILVLTVSLFITGCSDKNMAESNSQTGISSAVGTENSTESSISEVVEPQNSPTPPPTPEPVKVYVLATSPDGKYSVCDTGGYEADYFVLSNTTGEKIQIGRSWGGATITFISDTQFVFELDDYCIYNINGTLEYRLSDYFPLGETADGKDIVLLSIYHRDNGGKLILFTDRNESVTPEKWYNSGTLNEPHLYSIAVMSADNVVEKIINTRKHVESSKSHYTAPHMELIDENTLHLHTDYWNGESTVIGYEITVNLLTGESNIIDFRPEYDPQ